MALKERRRGIEFFGDSLSYLSLQSPNIFTTEVTIEAEFTTGNIKTGNYYVVYGDRAFELNIDSGGSLRLETSLFDAGTSTVYAFRASFPNGFLPYTKYKVIITRQGDTMTASINGVNRTAGYLDTRRALPFNYMTPANGTREVQIGRRYGSALPFVGQIHYIKVYSDAAATNLVHFYDFTKALTTAVPDQTGKGTTTTATGKFRVLQKGSNKIPKKNLLPPLDSGKWVLNANAVVNGPYSLILNATAAQQRSTVLINVKPGKTYTLSFIKGASTDHRIKAFDAAITTAFLSSSIGGSFVAPSDGKVVISLENQTGSGVFSFDNVQLEEGSSATAFEPLKELNKTSKKVPKKNLIKGFLDSGWVKDANATVLDNENLSLNGITQWRESYILVEVLPYTTYYASFEQGANLFIKTSDGLTTIASGTAFSFNSGANTKIRFVLTNSAIGNYVFKRPMLVKDSVLNSYEPYQEINKKAIKGKFMDGRANYIQLPGVQMDRIEIDCLIDKYQPKTGWFLFDARTTATADGFLNVGGKGSDVTAQVDGATQTTADTIPKGVRKTVNVTFSAPISNPLNLFSRFADNATDKTKGVIYGVKCYLNGKVVYSANYDIPKAAR